MTESDRKFGLIFNWEDVERCRMRGLVPDSARIERLEAPWDATDQPEITTWNQFEPYLRKQADVMDKLRQSGRSTYIFDYTFKNGINNDNLFITTQLTNDCTAFAAERCYLALVLHQIIRGAEQTVDRLNPMALYAASAGQELEVGQRIPNGGRTIYAIAEAACGTGASPAAIAGDYDGYPVYTQAMEDAKESARKHQMGWATFDRTDNPDAVADVVFLACRAGYPVLFGNSTAVQDGYDKDENGVCVARVNGSGWGGGHAQSWIDYQKINGTEYVLYANSHGLRYQKHDVKLPGWTVWMPRQTVKRMVSRYFDMLIGTWAEAPRSEPDYDLNPKGGRKDG